MRLFIKHKILYTTVFLLVLASCRTKAPIIESTSIPTEIELREVKTGAENIRKYLSKVKHKHAGIVTNQTGIVTLDNDLDKKLPSNQQSIVDYLLEHHINITKIYAPEHGFRGTADAGELIKDGFDTQTGLPIISLYGDNKKPKPEQLAGIDVMIFDLQDVGVRFYTYISSLHFVMEACAENDIPLIILDRPNPNINIIDGPILEMTNTSFVGMHPVPILHGMTIGEYAKMINGEKWLANGVQCELTIVACANYHRNHSYSLPVKPSPNLPNDQSINLYASLCFFEGTNVSVGRGTETQFQIYGSPYLPIRDFYFIPKPNLGSKSPLHNGRLCFGEDLTNYPKVSQLELKWLLKAYENTIDKNVFFTNFFTKLAGTKQLQEQIISGLSEEEIRKSWEIGLEAFKKMREQYLIY
ncbi:exo-beta-N-acetylmuramidase NamZ domain-containing protein [Flavobacterium sp.]|jgi:uncharacterized protein YbbC (DUF1343 family)|uniref:exo-beta-N-acetylmuramidase NamZ family protein n=1 Tax=Flavobacterium sp. TaxID=239 RepID=UPI0037C1878A